MILLAMVVVMLALETTAFVPNRVAPPRISRSIHMGDNNEKSSLSRALQQAKDNRQSLESPGAGVEDAFEAAEAAYADLILTSIDQRELEDELDEEDLADLSRGGTMWEKGAKDKQNSKKGGFVGDLFNALSALSGGAHIVKDENGET